MKANYLQELNPSQRQAVEDIEGPSLIVAGAGSGKTKVITCRIAYMLEHGIAPYQILALTFTNKAAKEMKERIALLIGEQKVRYLWMGTFHSVFARILRSEAQLLGFPSNFTIYDKSDSKSLIKSCIKDLHLDEKNYPVNDVMGRISKAKNALYTSGTYAGDAAIIQADTASQRPQITDIYTMYDRKCRQAGAMDFDDLLLYTNILLHRFPEVLAKYRDRWRYILVDEYQDTNTAQYFIIKALAQEHKNIAVVGDDAQSIYAFRGAKIENILNFKKDFPDAQRKEYRLEQNYRSTQTIVNAANSLIKHNMRRMPKECFSKAELGDKIEIISSYTDMEEALQVASSINSHIYKTKTPYGEFAILYRTNSQSRVIEEVLRKRNIPYRIYGGTSFYERAEVKDFMAYLRLFVNPQDNEAFRRAVNIPARGIGATTMQKLMASAEEAREPMYRYVQKGDLQAAGIKGATEQRLRAFVEMFETLRSEGVPEGTSEDTSEEPLSPNSAYSLAIALATKSGFLAAMKQDASIDGKARLENIEELLNSIQSFCQESKEELESEVAEPLADEQEPTLERYLANVSLLSQTDDKTDDKDADKVNLMTVHAAKGLEFTYVYVVGLEEQLFPSLQSTFSEVELEEERRLCYVAMTRAKKGLALSYAQTRMRWGTTSSNPPSRFLKEIDERFLSQSVAEKPQQDRFGEPSNYQNTYGQNSYGHNSYAQHTQTQRGYGHSYGSRMSAPVEKVEPVKPRIIHTSAQKIEGFIAEDSSLFKEGMKVEHDRFGKGTILKMEGIPPNAKAVIDFEFGGSKTLLLKFAKLRTVSE